MEIFPSRLGKVELTDERTRRIATFHPEVKSYKKYFASALAEPDVIRRSRFDASVFVLYRTFSKKYLAIVIKTNKRNFILTAYLTGKIQHHPL